MRGVGEDLLLALEPAEEGDERGHVALAGRGREAMAVVRLVDREPEHILLEDLAVDVDERAQLRALGLDPAGEAAEVVSVVVERAAGEPLGLARSAATGERAGGARPAAGNEVETWLPPKKSGFMSWCRSVEVG